MFFLLFSYSDLEMEKEEERNSLDIKWQDDILEDPLSIKDNVKEEERNSLDIRWQDEIVKDNVNKVERNSLVIKLQDNILEDPISVKDNVKEEEENSLDIKWQDDILKDPLSIKDEGKYITEGKTLSIIESVISLKSLMSVYLLVGLCAGLSII